MATNATPAPAVNSNVVKIIGSVGVGLRLLPTFVLGIETLFGKKTGVAKKDAVTALVNASIFGSAFGLNLAGSPEYGQVLAALTPAIDQNIDEVASQFFPPKPTPAAALPGLTPVPASTEVRQSAAQAVAAPVSANVDGSDPVLANAG